MNNREDYINKRLMELSLVAEKRELEEIEKREEKCLLKELDEIKTKEKINEYLRLK